MIFPNSCTSLVDCFSVGFLLTSKAWVAIKIMSQTSSVFLVILSSSRSSLFFRVSFVRFSFVRFSFFRKFDIFELERFV